MGIAARIVVFGDVGGIQQLLRTLPAITIVGVTAAAIRPQYLDALRKIASSMGVHFMVQPRATSEEYPAFAAELRALQPDLILVNSYSMLIRKDILDIPMWGCVNVHGALLPQYRGSNPIQWALINNEIETGATMHYMDAGFDTGDVIAQRRTPIYFDDTWRDIKMRIDREIEIMLMHELPKLLTGLNARTPQEEALARHWRRRYPEDGLIDWKREVIYIYNLIRALVNPHPGAFYYNSSGEKIVLDKFCPIPRVVALKYGEVGGQKLLSRQIRLEPLTVNDLPFFVEWLGNNAVNSKTSTFILSVNGILDSGFLDLVERRNDMVVFSVRQSEDKELIGGCLLHRINAPYRSAEILLSLNEPVQYGVDVMRLLLLFAFTDLNLNRIYISVLENDTAFIEICKRCGFEREGVLRKSGYINGEFVNQVLLGILRDEYQGC